MSMPQVGQGAVAVVPTFKGFRSSVTKETDAAAKQSTKGFRNAWSKEGTASGKETGTGFKRAFESESKGFTDKPTQELERAVTKSARALSQARLKQLDQVGKVRVAERQLAEAQKKYANDSSQVVRALERLQTATRQLDQANENTERSTKELRDAQSNLASAADRAGDQLAESGRRGGRRFITGFREVFAGSFLGTTFANFVSSITSQLTYAIGNGIRAGLDFAVGTVDLASDLNESVNAVTVSYGAASEAVLALGDNSAKAFGLSKRDLNQYAVQFSAFVSTLAGSGGDVAATLQTLIGRGTDFASVMNLEVAEALLLFQSGLAGETEPLRKYGIDLSAATVQAYAYANGIASAGDELTEQQKVQARYGALLAQTSKVQGDFANTSSELANQNRINAAVWTDLQTTIGTAFLPVASQLASVLADEVLPAISDLLEGPGSVKGVRGAFTDALPPLQQFAKDVLPLLPELFKSIAETLPDVIRLVTEMAPVILDLTQATNSWFVGLSSLIQLIRGDISLEEYGAKLGDLQGSLGDVARAIDSFGATTRAGFATIQSVVSVTVGLIQSKLNEAVAFFQSLPTRITSALSGAGTWLYNSGKALIQGFINGISSMLKPVGDAVGGLMDWVKGFFPNSPAKRGPFSGAGWSNLPKSGAAVIAQWESGMPRTDLTGRLTPTLAQSATRGSTGRTAAAAGAGETWILNGITTRETAAQIRAEIEKTRRRKLATTISSVTSVGVG